MIRVATVGTSMITHRFAEAARRVDGIGLSCVYSRDPARAERVGRELGAASWSSDYAGVLERPDVDACYVASPNTVHYEHVLAAIRAGKHVLVEKPATPTAAELDRLLRAAREAGVVLLEGIRNLYDPGFELVRELLPRLGAIRRVTLRFHQRSARYDKVLAGERVNVFDPAMAGGALFDLGVYCVQTLVELFGRPESVLAASVNVTGGAEGAGATLAIYPGFVADLSYSKITVSTTPSEIEGERGTLLIDHIGDPRHITFQGVDGGAESIEVAKPAGDHLSNMVYELARFASAVNGDVDISTDQERSLVSAEVVDAIRAASVA